MNLTLNIELHSYWHCGSGLAAGADVDALVVKDENGLPFIPGKTIKGLLREAVTEIEHIEGKQIADELFCKTFGFFDKETTNMQTAETYFSNAELPQEEQKAIIDGHLEQYLYKGVSATAIDANGIAIEHSLRRTEVCVPCELVGRILDAPEEMADILVRAGGFIKQLGSGRNRGLGRCTITIRKEDKI